MHLYARSTGHHINALIGHGDALASLAERLGPPGPVSLAFGLAILPLDETRLDAIAISTEASADGFTYLTPEKARTIARTVGTARAPYIETDYFGGMGAQGAALFEHGAMVWSATESLRRNDARCSRAC